MVWRALTTSCCAACHAERMAPASLGSCHRAGPDHRASSRSRGRGTSYKRSQSPGPCAAPACGCRERPFLSVSRGVTLPAQSASLARAAPCLCQLTSTARAALLPVPLASVGRPRTAKRRWIWPREGVTTRLSKSLMPRSGRYIGLRACVAVKLALHTGHRGWTSAKTATGVGQLNMFRALRGMASPHLQGTPSTRSQRPAPSA